VIDKFRGRIIIPIRDASGGAIGLGGRIMPGAEGPKYLNSPAGPLFDKSRTLYAINLAKAAIRREKLTVIVEGYTDVMAAHQAGFENVVASLGTALTRGQVELATRYADAVALAYDVDLAGEQATQRGLIEELGSDQSVSKVRVVRIPAGKDPDELIRTDPDAWRAAVADAKPVIDYFIDRSVSEVDMGSVAGKRELTSRVLTLLKRVADPIVRSLYLQRLAQLVGVEERVLADALQREPVRRPVARPPVPLGPGNGNGEGAPARLALSPLESEALGLLLRHPRLVTELTADQPLPLRDATAASLAMGWRDFVATTDGAPDLDRFVAGLDPASADMARTLIARTPGEGDGLDAETAAEVLRVTLLRLRVARLEEDLRDGRLLLEEAQREGDGARLATLEQRISQIGREKADATKAMQEPAGTAGVRRS